MIVLKSLRQPSVSLLVAILILLPRLSESCMSCLHPVSLPHKHNAHHHHSQAISIAVPHGMNPWGTGSRSNSIAVATTAARQLLEICKKRCMNLHRSICTNPNYQRSLRLSASAALVAGGMITLARHHHLPSTVTQRLHRGLWRNELADGQDAEAIPDGDNLAGGDEATEEKEEPAMSSAMITTIGIYKNYISPLLPPACRFVPTCSQYGVQAIKEFGPSKGVILTSWRLLRCSPFGGKGYDPPKWPPVSYTYSSY